MNALNKKIVDIINSKINLIPDDYKEPILNFLNLFTGDEYSSMYIIIDQTLSFLMDVLNLDDRLRPQFVIKIIQNNIRLVKHSGEIYFCTEDKYYLVKLFKKYHIEADDVADILRDCYENKEQLLKKGNLSPLYTEILKMIDNQRRNSEAQQAKYIPILGALENINHENIAKICLFLQQQNVIPSDIVLVKNYLEYKLNKLEQKAQKNKNIKISFQSSDEKSIVFSEKQYRQKLLEQKKFLENVKNGASITAQEYMDYIALARLLGKDDDEVELECRDLYPRLKVDESAYPFLDERCTYLRGMELDLIPILENIKEIKDSSNNPSEQSVWNELLQEFYEELYLRTSQNFKYERNLKK